MPGPPPKIPERRINRVTKRLGLADRVEPPAMPRGLCQQARTQWEDFWGDEVSRSVRRPDFGVALRWIKNVDRYWKLTAEADREFMVTGSTGQPKVNPLYALCDKLDAQIRLDEAQLGIGGLARLRLGVLLTEQAKTLADLTIGDDDDSTEDFRANLALVPAPVAEGCASAADSPADT